MLLTPQTTMAELDAHASSLSIRHDLCLRRWRSVVRPQHTPLPHATQQRLSWADELDNGGSRQRLAYHLERLGDDVVANL